MCHAVLAVVSNCCPPLKGRFLTRYSPVRHCPLLQLDESSFRRFSFDLHVLSTPPAFVLSQDQTLMFNSCLFQLVHLSTPQPSTLLSPGSLPWLRRDPPGFTQVSPDSPRLLPDFAGSPPARCLFLAFRTIQFSRCALCCLADSPFSLPNHLLLVNYFFTQF